MNVIPITSTKWSVVSAMSSISGLIALEFTSSELAVFGMVAGLVTSLIASVTSIILARQNRTAINENTTLTEAVKAKADAIGVNVDGLKSKDATRIAELEREILAGRQREIDAEKRAVALAGTSAPVLTVTPGTNPHTSGLTVTETKVDPLKDTP